MTSRLNIYVGCPEEDLSNDYLCLDIDLPDGSEIPVEQSEYIGSLSEKDFLAILGGFCNRANYLAKELGLPISIGLEEILLTCIEENFSESALKAVRSLAGELRKVKGAPEK